MLPREGRVTTREHEYEAVLLALGLRAKSRAEVRQQRSHQRLEVGRRCGHETGFFAASKRSQ